MREHYSVSSILELLSHNNPATADNKMSNNAITVTVSGSRLNSIITHKMYKLHTVYMHNNNLYLIVRVLPQR